MGNAGGPRASGGHVRNARTHGFGWVPAFLSAPIHIATVESFKNNERVGHPVSRVANERGSDASAALRLRCVPHLRDLPSTPVLTSTSVRRIYDVSAQAASTALEELCSAGILRRSRRQRIVLYQCDDVLDLVTLAERRLASTRFDTRVSTPTKPVPAYLAEQR